MKGKFKKIDPINQKYFEDYAEYLELHSLKEKTIEFRLWKVYGFLIWSDFRDAKIVEPADVKRFYLERKKTKSESTAFGDIRDLRLFLGWLLPGKEIITFKPKQPKNDLPPEKVLQADNVRSILAACESHRDRALVTTYWDSAARLNEILDCNIGHVSFDRYGAVISVTGKTGRRNIRLISSVPDLQAWINIHPLKHDPDAPLFVTSRKRGTTTFHRLNQRTVQNLFHRLGDLSGCPKNTNPHAFRHGRLTIRGKQLTDAELREYAGWSKNSNMSAVYVHLSSRDIDDKILTVEGIVQEGVSAPDPMAPIICPRCKKSNASDAMFCESCSMILNEEGTAAVGIARNLMSDPDELIAYANWKKTQKNLL